MRRKEQFFSSPNQRNAKKLLRAIGHFASGQFILSDGQGLFGRTIPVILTRFNVLVFFEGEQKFASGEVVLVTRRKPDAGGDFDLVDGKDAAAIELAENSSAEGNVFQQMSFGANHLVGVAVDPDFGDDVRD